MTPSYAPPPWTNQELILYHGTTASAARQIAVGKIALHYGRRGTDFGPGFYTTTIEQQARAWALRVADKRRQAPRHTKAPAIVEIRLSREEVAGLQFMAFVDQDAGAEEFWSFVHHCQNGAMDHGRAIPGSSKLGYYDVVFGPLARNWKQRTAYPRADQVSFHTKAAVRLLNTRARRRIIEP
jgi:hypothetical protein